MILILEVTSAQRAKLGGASRQTFDTDGGSIGRENDNSWVLPHAKVSGHHALISYSDAVFYIEDTSRNGVCLNSTRNRLERGRPYPLTSGDRILIDPYEIEVTIGRDEYEQAGRRAVAPEMRPSDHPLNANPFESDDPFAPRPFPSSGLDAPEEAIAGQEVDPLELLKLAPPKRPPARKAPQARRSRSRRSAGRPFSATRRVPGSHIRSAAESGRDPRGLQSAVGDSPRLRSAGSGYSKVQPLAGAPEHDNPPAADPRGYEPFAPKPSPPPPLPSPPDRLPVSARPGGLACLNRRRSPSLLTDAAASRAFGAVWRWRSFRERRRLFFVRGLRRAPGGRRSGSRRRDARARAQFGQILRVVVSGVMDVMRARQQIKDEFRMRMTQFRPADNNPLKFSANVDDALHNLLVKRNAAYLAPVEAFEDAFDDLRNHQIAMLAGMRVAFESMLAEFDPDRLQEEFDRQLEQRRC